MKFAIAVNFCGAAIMVTLPWLIGKKGGGTMVSSIMKKYPKTEKLKRDLYRKWVHTDISSPGDRKNTE